MICTKRHVQLLMTHLLCVNCVIIVIVQDYEACNPQSSSQPPAYGTTSASTTTDNNNNNVVIVCRTAAAPLTEYPDDTNGKFIIKDNKLVLASKPYASLFICYTFVFFVMFWPYFAIMYVLCCVSDDDAACPTASLSH